MEKNDLDKIDELLQLSKHLQLTEFENYVAQYLERKADKVLAIEELDHTIGMLQTHLLSFSMYVKQNFLLKKVTPAGIRETEFFTKQEIAAKYRVSVRTVTNWIVDGLEAAEIGGVVRISNCALKAFVLKKKEKLIIRKSPQF